MPELGRQLVGLKCLKGSLLLPRGLAGLKICKIFLVSGGSTSGFRARRGPLLKVILLSAGGNFIFVMFLKLIKMGDNYLKKGVVL